VDKNNASSQCTISRFLKKVIPFLDVFLKIIENNLQLVDLL